MNVPQSMDNYDDSHVDWAFLPPTAMHVIGTHLPSSSLLRARAVNRHWASCLAGVVDTLYVVPEYFLTDDSAQEVPKAFPKASTVNLDLQDTFMTVPEAVKDSLDRYMAQRSGGASSSASQEHTANPSPAAAASQATPASADSGAAGPAGSSTRAIAEPSQQFSEGSLAGMSPADRTSAGPSTSGMAASGVPQQGGSQHPGAERQDVQAQQGALHAQGQAGQGSSEPQQSSASALEKERPAQASQPAQSAAPSQQHQQQQQQPGAGPLNPMAALFAAMAAVGMNNNPADNPAGNPDGAALPPALPIGAAPPAAVAAAAAAAAAAAPQPPPTFPYSAVPVDPLPSIVPPGTSHLRIRLPDTHDVASHFSDMTASWDYISSLLSRVGPKLSGLSLSTAPDAAHVSMLSPLTQLTSLTMDEASHSTWSAEHLPIVGSLTNLCSLAIKIPPFRNSRPDPGTVTQQQLPSALSSWSALQRLTKLHVSALRYTFHASLVSVLPHLTKLEYLALRAPQTRLPWPGTDRPLFSNIGLLTGLTQLSLALGDHNMMPQDWQSLTTLARLSAIEISVSEGSDGLNVPVGLDFPALRNLKLRYPNSQDLVRIAGWSGICKLDIKFPEHEREWHQEDAVVELLDFRNKLPSTPGSAIIAAVLDNAPASASGVAPSPAAAGTTAGTTAAAGGCGRAAADVVAAGGADRAAQGGAVASVVVVPRLAAGTATTTAAGGEGAAAGTRPPTGAGSTAGLTAWWSPLLPLLALPNMTDFRCSAKEGLASHDPILFDQIVAGLCTAWPGITRLCFKGFIDVSAQPPSGWDAVRSLTKLQQLELRHHPPFNPEDNPDNALPRNARNPRFLRVEPIKLPATSLPDSLQTLLLENVELRRKETDCLVNLTSLERRTTCRHFPEFVGMPLQRLVVSNCCVKAKGISSIAKECAGLTHLVFAVYKVTEQADMKELQAALKDMVTKLKQLQVLKVRVLAGCITKDLVEDMVTHLPHLQRLKLTSSDGWEDTALFLPLTRMAGLRKCSLAYFKSAEAARLLRQEFRTVLPYCKIKAKQEAA